MKIASAASAFPKHYYSQRELLQRLQDYWGAELKNPLLLARLHRNVTVDGRYLAIPAEEYAGIKTWGQANDIWIRVAQELGEQALCLALHKAGLSTQDLGALLFTTVTGVASPSIDGMLINRMKLPARIRRTPIFGRALNHRLVSAGVRAECLLRATKWPASEFASKRSGATQRPRREEHAAPPAGNPAVAVVGRRYRQKSLLTLS